MDEQLNLVPDGQEGELIIGGDGVALGNNNNNNNNSNKKNKNNNNFWFITITIYTKIIIIN